MTAPRQILVVDGQPGLRTPITCDAGESSPGIVANVVSTIAEAVDELRRSGYDAVLIHADSPREIALLLRIKTSAPGVPLIALVEDGDPSLNSLARESGADEVMTAAGGAEAAIRELSRAPASTDELISRSRAVMRRSRNMRDQMADLLEQGRRIAAESFHASRVPVAGLVPLAVEDDENQALFLERAFKRSELPFQLPVLKDGEEAIAYLSGDGKYADRSAFPLPSLMLLDLRLPRKSGFEVLSWIRSRPEFAELVVFVLTSSPLPEDVDRAMAIGADHFYVKPLSIGGLTDLVKIMAQRWARIRRAHERRRKSRANP